MDKRSKEYEAILGQLYGAINVKYSEDGVNLSNKEVDLTFKPLVGSSSYFMFDNLSKTGCIVPVSAFNAQMETLGINIANFYQDWLEKNFQDY